MHAGIALKAVREELGITLAEFSARTDVAIGSLSDWENGNRTMTVEGAAKIERALNRDGLVEAVVKQRSAPKAA